MNGINRANTAMHGCQAGKRWVDRCHFCQERSELGECCPCPTMGSVDEQSPITSRGQVVQDFFANLPIFIKECSSGTMLPDNLERFLHDFLNVC